MPRRVLESHRDCARTAEGQPWRIVLADDAPEARVELRRLLTEAAPSLCTFLDVDTAAEAARAVCEPDVPPDCLLLAARLPDANAPEVLARIVDEEGGCLCPVVVLSDGRGDPSSDDVLRAGAQDCVDKRAITAEALGRAVDHAVIRHRLARERIDTARKALVAARENEALYRALAAELPHGAAFVVDRDLRYRLADGEALRAAGLSSAALEGRRIDEAWPEPIAKPYVEHYRAVLAGTSVRIEHELGGRHYITHTAPLRRTDGEVYAALAVSYDITDRKRAEEALRESEQHFRCFVELNPQMPWLAGPDGAIVEFSDRVLRFAGIARDEVLGDGWLRMVHPDDLPRTIELWSRSVRTGEPCDVEHRMRRVDGTYRWMRSRAFARRDDEGRVIRWYGTTEDIGQRKAIEEELRNAQALTQEIIDGSTALVFAKDLEGRYFLTNRAWREFVGLRREDAEGATDEDVFGAEIAAMLRKHDLRVLETGTPIVVEEAGVVRGRLVTYLSSKFPLRDEQGRIYAVCGVSADVTDQKRREDGLRDADRRKDDFLATLAHELRNPIAPIRNGLAILQHKVDDARAVADVRDMMERQLTHLVRLVDDLLDVSRVRHGKIELRRQPVDVHTVFAHALESCRPTIEASGHALTVREPNDALWVNGDLTRLAQVVSNLLNNAAKYTPAGGHLELSARAEGDDAVLCVSDDGAGISTEMLPRVFDLFTQEHRALDRAQSGLGIGLSLARKLVELHGGTIEVASAGLGQGSSFTVRLPRTAPAAIVTKPSAQPPARAVPLRVLVVDDHVEAAESLAQLVGLAGHQALTAHNGPDAIELARSLVPDLVFLDIGMPGMDGYQVAKRLRDEPRTATAVLVALTGWGGEAEQRKAKAVGFAHYFTKPVDVETIGQVLRECGGPSPPSRDSGERPVVPG